LEIPALTGNRR
jgi:copper chaperone CopZ